MNHDLHPGRELAGTEVRTGLIQMSLKADVNEPVEQIRDKMLEAHLPLIRQAAEKGVQVLCFQEIFTLPYFCPSQDRCWYKAAERVPSGFTTRKMQELAEK